MTTLSDDMLRDLRAQMEARMVAAAPGLIGVRTSGRTPGTGVVSCVVRDEMTHLPHFLAHHREIGVRRFAFVDNLSSDGTVDYLLAQPDCDVYRHGGDVLAAASGAVWRNLLLRRYPDAPWQLGIDADELAVYDGWPGREIDAVAAALTRAGRGSATGIMIDLYGPGPILETRVGPGQSLLEACPLFDGDGYTIEQPVDWRAENFPRLNIRGGPEMRAIRGRSEYGWLAKNPLILAPDVVFRDTHTVLPVEQNFAHPQLAILHLRWFDHFAGKLERVRAWRQHRPGSIHAYEQVAVRLEAEPGFSFSYAGSRRLESGRQLVTLGLIDPIAA